MSSAPVAQTTSSDLAVIESLSCPGGITLAVCKDSQRLQHLAIKSTRPVADAAGKRPKKDDKGESRKREDYWQKTSNLAHINLAITRGLLAT